MAEGGYLQQDIRVKPPTERKYLWLSCLFIKDVSLRAAIFYVKGGAHEFRSLGLWDWFYCEVKGLDFCL